MRRHVLLIGKVCVRLCVETGRKLWSRLVNTEAATLLISRLAVCRLKLTDSILSGLCYKKVEKDAVHWPSLMVREIWSFSPGRSADLYNYV